MDDDVREELRRLRARAYGPDADISEHPDAWARLRELEDLDKRDRARADIALAADAPLAVEARNDGVPTAGGAEPGAARAATIADADDPASEESDDAPVERRPLLRTRRRVWVAAVALAGVAAVASAATAVGTSFTTVERTAGIAQVDALTPAPDAELAGAGYLGFDPSNTRGFADYHGLTAFAGTTQVDSDGNRAECLLLSDTQALGEDASARRTGGVRSGGCGAGPFPATVEFVVTSSFPAEFRARFPVGSAVQFVLDGDDVGVFSDAR